MKTFLVCFITFSTVLHSFVTCLDNGLALTPPMGWMAWQRFRCVTDCQTYPDECISEHLFRKMAELMVSEGYLDAGYEYIIIDDCWMANERDEDGRLQSDPERFPSGIKALADYVHSLGLKFGIYEDYGNFTCAGYPGILGHLETDAQTFADWDVDYLKLDGCYSEQEGIEEGYAEFGRLLNKTGRPIVYSCSWPAYQEYSGINANYEALKKTCNLWRNWGDIDDSWTSVQSIAEWFAKNQDRIAEHSGPGHWNDPDMLIIGNFGLSYDQSKAQMAIWSVMAAPLIMSVDLRTIRPEFKEILTNPEAIKINQDALGVQGFLINNVNGVDVWIKPILPIVNSEQSYAVALVSQREDGMPYQVSVSLNDIGLLSSRGYTVKNIFDRSEPVEIPPGGSLTYKVNPTGAVLLRLTPLLELDINNLV